MIKDLRVLINGRAVKASWHVTAGEQVTVILYPGGAKVAEDIPFKVVYEDEQILALIKPAGVLVHPARGHKTGDAVQRAVALFSGEARGRSVVSHRHGSSARRADQAAS